MIPPIFMQTLFGYDDVPPKWRAAYESVDRVMPSYEHVLLKEASYRPFVRRYFPDFLDVFESYPLDIQRCDAIRYLWLYVYGGVYMDLDMLLRKDLTPFFQTRDIVLAQEIDSIPLPFLTQTHANCLMASIPRHPFWLECVQLMKQRADAWYPTKELRIVFTTGPGILSTVAKRYRDHIYTMPRQLVNGCGTCRCTYDESSYVIPLQGGTWMSPWVRWVNFFLCRRILLATICSCFLLTWFVRRMK